MPSAAEKAADWVAESNKEITPSMDLLKRIETYLGMVDAGRQDGERSFQHDMLILDLRREGYEFQTREEARALARKLWEEHQSLLNDVPWGCEG